jgi:cytosine/adenosine deaminase-related metal-dependent hydrolase
MSQPHAIRLVGGTLLVHDDNDNVEALANTDILIKSGKIAEIGMNIRPTPNTQVIDCHGKIISPGFVDTHHHVWQTQLKGRHSDDTLLDYHPKGKHSIPK